MLCRRFDSQCSFIENIRESSKRNGLVDLQKQLASEISDSRFVKDISNTDEGIRSIKSRAGSKKVLIVLDDLDDEEQLKKLVAGPETFASGSIIIITTRDKKILDDEKRILTYEVKEMDPDKALELFTWHAFRSLSPPDTHESLSREVASTTGGLPLALEVIGSSLRGKGKTIWEEMLKRLKKAPHNKVQEKLKISYDALGDMEKEIFLDIACFFVNEKKSSATYFWDACDLSPHIALEELSDLCLIKIDKSDDMWMHDQLRDLGRDIVRQECTRNPTGRSRLWNSQEALKVVRSKERKDKVQALNLVQHCSDPISIAEEELERMPNLKFLKLRAATFVGDVNEYLLDLTWLSWDSPPPLDCRMANLHLENLAVFELSDNRNTENWDGWNILKMAAKLKVLSLTRCKGLKRTPDFSGCVSLERLSFYDCPNLQEVDSSIGKLERLTNLDIIWCKSLRTLPEEIGGLVNLKLFYMRGCKKLDKLPSSIWKLASFSRLFIPSTGITRLPNSIGNAKHLLSIDLGYTPIGELPTSIGELTQLEYLSLHQCPNIRELPESIGKLTSLEYLYLSETTIVELPDSIKNLTRLKVLSVAGTLIRRLPASIGSLVRLELLDARHCKELEGELPPDIGKLLSLRELDLSNTRICAVPTTINSLTLLQKLDLTDCNELQELPELPSSLKYLRVRSTSLRLVADLKNLTNLVEFLCQGSGQAPAQASNPMQTLPLSLCLPEPSTDSNSVVFGLQLSHVKNLARLDLSRSPLREIQLNGLELLRDLAVRECEFLEVLSISLGKLRQMEVFDCPKLHEVRFLGEMELLEKLHVKNCNSLGKLSSLSNLKKLKSLLVDECDELRDLEGLEEMELLSFLSFVRCGSLERLTHAPKSKPKIPNGCRMYVLDCAKFQGPNRSTFSYEDYWKEEMKKRETAS
ncbi:Auxin-responsive protein [Psidium guajava]|nr:Auxin-responsive protein [Psidium guajava]